MYRHVIVAIALSPFCLVRPQLDEEIDGDLGFEEVEGSSLRGQSLGNLTKKLVSASQAITLTCSLGGVDFSDSDIAWFYKPCGVGSAKRPCDPSKDIGGQKICHEAEDDRCPAKLIVDKPKPGLYRCYKTGQKTGYTMTATLVSAYLIEIIERKLEPEFLEVPEEVEAFVGFSALFQCRVKSHLPLHVKWYKQVPKSAIAIQYENKFYQGMNGSSTVRQGDIYVSKLKFKKLTLQDSGIYACGAVNEAGIQYRDANLIVTQAISSTSSREAEGYWKMALFGSAAGFLILLIASFCCVHLAKVSCSCRQPNGPSALRESPAKGRHHRPLPPSKMWSSPEPETSDYEHVVTL